MLKEFIFSCIIILAWSGSLWAYVTNNPNDTVTIGGHCTINALYMTTSSYPNWMLDKNKYLLPDNHTYNFYLYTRGKIGFQKRHFSVQEALTGTTYDPSKPTFFYFHGWTEFVHLPSIQLIKKEYLKKVDGNVILIDWFLGAEVFNNYPQSAANADGAACQAYILIKNLIQLRGANIKNFYLSGHSMGVQAAARTAKRLKAEFNSTVSRISALDPTRLWYVDQTNPVYHLDKSDADFVDVIHTGDGYMYVVQGYMGDIHPVGHVDFYPDGGRSQNACPAPVLLVNDITVLCSHFTAPWYFATSINGPCNYTSCYCPNVPDPNTTQTDWEQCLKNCNPATSSTMGYYANESPGRGPQYLEISKSNPKCTTFFSYLHVNNLINVFTNIAIGLLKFLKLYNPMLNVVKFLQLHIGNFLNKIIGKFPLPIPFFG